MFCIHLESSVIGVVTRDKWLNSAKTIGPVTCDGQINRNGTVTWTSEDMFFILTWKNYFYWYLTADKIRKYMWPLIQFKYLNQTYMH